MGPFMGGGPLFFLKPKREGLEFRGGSHAFSSCSLNCTVTFYLCFKLRTRNLVVMVSWTIALNILVTLKYTTTKVSVTKVKVSSAFICVSSMWVGVHKFCVSHKGS